MVYKFEIDCRTDLYDAFCVASLLDNVSAAARLRDLEESIRTGHFHTDGLGAVIVVVLTRCPVVWSIRSAAH